MYGSEDKSKFETANPDCREAQNQRIKRYRRAEKIILFIRFLISILIFFVFGLRFLFRLLGVGNI